METILGLAIIYSWVHGLILLLQKKDFNDRTRYEQAVIVVGIITLVICIIGLQ